MAVAIATEGGHTLSSLSPSQSAADDVVKKEEDMAKAMNDSKLFTFCENFSNSLKGDIEARVQQRASLARVITGEEELSIHCEQALWRRVKPWASGVGKVMRRGTK